MPVAKTPACQDPLTPATICINSLFMVKLVRRIGRFRTRFRVALNTALATAAAIIPTSPIPLMPNLLTMWSSSE
jgi:hypothetical protein